MRGKLVYWPLNRLNEEESGRGQGAGKGDHVEEQEEKGNPASKLLFLKREDEGNSISVGFFLQLQLWLFHWIWSEFSTYVLDFFPPNILNSNQINVNLYSFLADGWQMSDQKGKDKEKGDKRKAMEGWRRWNLHYGHRGTVEGVPPMVRTQGAKTQRGRSGIPLTQTSTPTHSGNGFITEPPPLDFTHPWSQTLWGHQEALMCIITT